jgi:hypothetical protein
MSQTISSLTLDATRIAIRAAGPYPHVEEPLSAAVDSMSPRVPLELIPGPSDVGWDVTGAGAALLAIVLHRDVRSRTVYLVIDRATAPLTGNYTTVISGVTVTYNATSSAPADVDALLAGIVAALAASGSMAALVTASVVATQPGGDADAIRLVAVSTGAAYATFTVDVGTSYPAGAALVAWCEYDTASTCELYVRDAPIIDSASSSATSAPYIAALSAWKLAADLAAGVPGDLIPSGGYTQRLDVAGLGAVFIRLSGTLADGYASCEPLAYVYVAPCRED